MNNAGSFSFVIFCNIHSPVYPSFFILSLSIILPSIISLSFYSSFPHSPLVFPLFFYCPSTILISIFHLLSFHHSSFYSLLSHYYYYFCLCAIFFHLPSFVILFFSLIFHLFLYQSSFFYTSILIFSTKEEWWKDERRMIKRIK